MSTGLVALVGQGVYTLENCPETHYFAGWQLATHRHPHEHKLSLKLHEREHRICGI